VLPSKVDSVVAELRAEAVGTNLKGMKRYGIKTEHALGVSLPKLRRLARRIGRDHETALALWETGIHEARILASLVDAPEDVTEAQAEKWVRDFDSWDVCDCCCGNLLDKTRFAYQKAAQWSEAGPEFVKRAGFVLMAALAVHDKAATDNSFVDFFPMIRRGALDERNFVRKAVNWAIRQIGKRNLTLNGDAVALARGIRRLDSPSARWIASDALRELTGQAVQRRLRLKEKRGTKRSGERPVRCSS